MAVGKNLKAIAVMEKELHSLRVRILQEENGLLLLEKQLFEAEHAIELARLKELNQTKNQEKKTEREIQHMKKTLGGKIKKLASSSKAEKLSNAILEHQLLQQELNSLQAGFKKELEKMGKPK